MDSSITVTRDGVESSFNFLSDFQMSYNVHVSELDSVQLKERINCFMTLPHALLDHDAHLHILRFMARPCYMLYWLFLTCLPV